MVEKDAIPVIPCNDKIEYSCIWEEIRELELETGSLGQWETGTKWG